MARTMDERRFLTASLIDQTMRLVAMITILEGRMVAEGHAGLVTRVLDAEAVAWRHGDRGPVL